jgi:SMP-30/Gluconolactonase/LRE-like region
MKPSSLRFWLVPALFLALTVSAQTTDNYEPGPDSKPRPNVPKGEILKFTFNNSKIFPGTTRDYWVYVPAQYKFDKPACVFVCQDGIRYAAPTVFDNLINKKEMPVTIGVFVAPGVVKATDANAALDRFNRSFEYDGLGDNYAYYWLHVADTSDWSNADGLRVDRDGRLYVATRMGVQVCDQAGRVQCIIPTPNGRLSNIAFGGAAFDTVFATCGDKIYKRKLRVTGANAWDKPNKSATPRL